MRFKYRKTWIFMYAYIKVIFPHYHSLIFVWFIIVLSLYFSITNLSTFTILCSFPLSNPIRTDLSKSNRLRNSHTCVERSGPLFQSELALPLAGVLSLSSRRHHVGPISDKVSGGWGGLRRCPPAPNPHGPPLGGHLRNHHPLWRQCCRETALHTG